jgi:hypothetical protein
VRALIEVLEKNQGTLRGGSETKALQLELNNAIVSTLRKLTGQSFPVESIQTKDAPSLRTYSANDLKKVIQTAKKWLASTKRS